MKLESSITKVAWRILTGTMLVVAGAACGSGAEVSTPLSTIKAAQPTSGTVPAIAATATPPAHTNTPSSALTITTTLEPTTPRISVEIGKPYHHTLYTHCGIRSAEFDGRRWIADPILGGTNPSPGWGNPFDVGSMELVAEDRARFTSSAGSVAEFQPLPEGSEYPWRLPCI